MPPKADLSFAGLDNSVFKSKVSATITSVPKIKINASKTSMDSLENPKTIRSSAPIVEDWESDSKDENVFKPKEVKKTVKPSLKKIKFVNARNTTVENKNKAEKPRKFSQSPRDSEDENVFKHKEVKKTVKPSLEKIEFVNARNTTVENKNKAEKPRKSINHLIKDCDFYENKMVLNNKGKITAAILTKSRQVPVNAAKQSSLRAATSVGATIRVNTVASISNVNNALPITYSYYKAHSLVRRTGKLDFEDVYVMKELKFNLFSVSQIYDKKNNVLFTDFECVVLSPDFKLLDESQVLLKVPRNNNMNMNEFYEMKSIRREFSVARTPQQNGVAERKNRTLIEAARTMLADSKLSTTFCAEAVNTACYVQNRVLVIKPHNNTPYELF
nr:ribonuclease H-like domain-containing protein [Tanacetum cinerariifolium]